MKNLPHVSAEISKNSLFEINLNAYFQKIMAFLFVLVFSTHLHSQTTDCIDFTSFPVDHCDTFYLNSNPNQFLYVGCTNQSYGVNLFDGIYNTGINMDFNFDGSNQQIEIEGYGFIGQYGQMGYSINGGPFFYLDDTFPLVSNGVTIDLQLSGQQNNWDYYEITFTGAISTITHEPFESGITEICTEEITPSTEDCIDFTSFPTDHCDTFYLNSNPNQFLYVGCTNQSYGVNLFDGIYNTGINMDFNFDGSNQEIEIEGYGFIGQYGQMGYSINGGPFFYLDDTFPLVSNGVTVDLQLSGQQNNWDYYEITFTGAISTISHEPFESGITEICTEEITPSTEDCIDFTSFPTDHCDTFYLNSNPNQFLYVGCTNQSYGVNLFDGIYNTGINMDFNFDGSNQEIEIEGYGFLGQYGQMGYSVNGGPMFYLDDTFPLISNGVTIDLQLSGQQNNWDYYEITFTGAISTISHEPFESGITEICTEEITPSTEDCIDFTSFPTDHCDTFYLNSNPNQFLYVGCTNQSYGVNLFDGIYNTGINMDFNFDGSNQEIEIEGYGFLGQYGQMGYSVNGGPMFYLDDTFPLVSSGVTVDLQLTGQQSNWDYYEITFTGAISTITHEPFESGITEICVEEEILSTENFSKNEIEVNVFPNPTNAGITIQTDEKIESIQLIGMSGQIFEIELTNNNYLDLSILSSGVYLLNIYTNDAVIRKKVLKR
ncbi:T9SS type A sorting domain-containing protein [Brumimicrobium mesophilum]|uniref:T9SS type A sorting domain-containing protein n=1 Tax=Brumimicrobium mesophilum TaxID=392717 RepID=UPI00131B11CD|nr:T9SS type A sorting domain-containing protein [Brumimicrobium mesophilum]